MDKTIVTTKETNGCLVRYKVYNRDKILNIVVDVKHHYLSKYHERFSRVSFYQIVEAFEKNIISSLKKEEIEKIYTTLYKRWYE